MNFKSMINFCLYLFLINISFVFSKNLKEDFKNKNLDFMKFILSPFSLNKIKEEVCVLENKEIKNLINNFNNKYYFLREFHNIENITPLMFLKDKNKLIDSLNEKRVKILNNDIFRFSAFSLLCMSLLVHNFFENKPIEVLDPDDLNKKISVNNFNFVWNDKTKDICFCSLGFFGISFGSVFINNEIKKSNINEINNFLYDLFVIKCKFDEINNNFKREKNEKNK